MLPVPASMCWWRTRSPCGSDTAYASVRQWARDDAQSMNAWIEGVLATEDMRRRCAAHDRYLSEQPGMATFSQAWADRNLAELGDR